MQWRNPAKDGGYSYATGSTGPDSIVQLKAQDFRAAKFAFEFSCKPSDLLTLGFRYDYFLYLDPHAHANTLEPLTNEALSQCNANHTCNLPKWLPIILMIPFLVVLFRCTCISD